MERSSFAEILAFAGFGFVLAGLILYSAFEGFVVVSSVIVGLGILGFVTGVELTSNMRHGKSGEGSS